MLFFIDKYINFAVEFIKNVYQTSIYTDEIFSKIDYNSLK